MSKVLSKLEKKFAIPLDKRKPRMFKRKIKTNHSIPKPFKTMFHLLAAPEPDPIFVPEPYPKLGWSAVRFKPALPSPEACPMYGVSQDSEVYSMKNSGWDSTQCSTFTHDGKPFGTFPGYHTTHGVVSVPTDPVQGHIYCPASNRWVLHASLPAAGRGPAGGGRGPGTKRERGQEGGNKPRNHR